MADRLPLTITMRLIIVRHGAVSWNEAVDNDPPLNETGHAQARRLGERFQGQKIDRFYCSPMARARQTADLVAHEVDRHGAVRTTRAVVQRDDLVVAVGQYRRSGRSATLPPRTASQCRR